MRQGFLYIRLQIYFVLLALILGTALLFFTGLLQKDLRWHKQIQATALLNNVLDKMAEDIRYAEEIEVRAENIRLVIDGIAYTYFLNNQRLVRQKDGLLYLTPASIVLKSLRFTENAGLITVVLLEEKQNLERLIHR